MILSQSCALAAPPPARDTGARPCLTAAPDVTARRGGQDINLPFELDLRSHAGFARLRRMNLLWPELPDSKRRAWSRNLEIVLPPRALAARDIALLPGGAVTIRDQNAILVCDPAEANTFNETEAKRLRRVLGVRADVATVSHAGEGIVLTRRVPKSLPPQAVTVVPDASKLPVRTGFTGAVLIQWSTRGAVAWPLVAAPPTFALAASIAATPLAESRPGLVRQASPLAPETWSADDAEARFQLIAPALGEHAVDVIADTVRGDLRDALIGVCVRGSESLAWRIAQGLAMLPSCFLEDPAAIPGSPPASWRQAADHVRDATENLVLLGLDNMFGPVATIRALRDVIEDAEVLAVAGNGDALPGGPVPLHCDTGIFLARQAEEHGRLGLVMPMPASPVDLYTLAHDVAAMTGVRVIAVAPAWGFCHRVAPSGEESGNAGWFGMGAGLDEVDVMFADGERHA